MGSDHGKCLVLCLQKLHQRRENEKETQEEGNWERKGGKKAEANVEKSFLSWCSSSLQVLQQRHPPTQSAIPRIHSNFHLPYLSYSVLWSKRLIRGKVQHQKDLDPIGSSVTYKPLTLAKSVASTWDFLIYKLAVTAQILPAPVDGMRWRMWKDPGKCTMLVKDGALLLLSLIPVLQILWLLVIFSPNVLRFLGEGGGCHNLEQQWGRTLCFRREAGI